MNDGTKMHIGFEKDFHYNSIQREREILKSLKKSVILYRILFSVNLPIAAI